MTQSSIKVFVGYDSREDIAWQVCRHSLSRHSSAPIDIYPLRQPTLRELGLYTRPLDAISSTEFSLTRFLAPFLGTGSDWCVFVDCDFLFTRSLNDLVATLSPDKAVYVVQHDYVPANAVKMDGKAQTVYPRKNWSSFMIFNLRHPAIKSLTPSLINSAAPAYLHRFEWVEDADIGSLDLEWNFLEGEYPSPQRTPAAVHYTNGGPWFEQWQDVEFADLWRRERDLYLATQAEVDHADVTPAVA